MGNLRCIIHPFWKWLSYLALLSVLDADGQTSVKFGVLFNDDRCANIFEALVGTLKAAKKKKVVNFQGELLLQGVHDNVDVILLQEWGQSLDQMSFDPLWVTLSPSKYWAFLQKTEAQGLSGLSLSLCFQFLPSCARLSIWIQTQWPNRLDETAYVWTWLACLHMISLNSTHKKRYLRIFSYFQGKILSFASAAVFFNHGSDKSFWYF